MVVSKSSQTMTIYYGVREEGTVPLNSSFTINVVTNVVKNPEASLATTQAFASENRETPSDANRKQRSGTSPNTGNTNPTQLSNATYMITGTAVPSGKVGNVPTDDPLTDHQFGQPATATKSAQGLSITATQLLPEIDNPENLLRDGGYMIHITPFHFTNGCIGIHYDPTSKESRDAAEKQMGNIVDLYNYTMGETGDKEVSTYI